MTLTEASTSNIQGPTHKNSVGRDHTDSQTSWFYKRKKGVSDKWSDLPTQLVTGLGWEPSSLGPRSKVVSNLLHSSAWNERLIPWLFQSKASKNKQPKTHLQSTRSPAGELFTWHRWSDSFENGVMPPQRHVKIFQISYHHTETKD